MQKTIDPNKPQATIRDIAEFFGVNPRTVQNWMVDTPPVPFYKRGKTIRFKIAEIEAHLAQKQKAGSS